MKEKALRWAKTTLKWFTLVFVLTLVAGLFIASDGDFQAEIKEDVVTENNTQVITEEIPKVIEEKEPEIVQKSQLKEPDPVMVHIIAGNWVELNLKNPKSAEFPYKPTEYEVVTNKMGEIYKSKITSHVYAENGFGGTIRNEWQVIMWYIGPEEASMSSWIPVYIAVAGQVIFEDNIDLATILEQSTSE